MSDYLSISIIALYCYAFFLMAFLTAKRNSLINRFIIVLVNMVFWTGGSLLMRARVWPSYEFWYHVSVIGIWLLPCTYFRFIREYAGEAKRGIDRLWMFLLMAGSVINVFTNFFLAPPEIVRDGANIQFVYSMDWPVAIMYGLCAIVVVRIFKTIYDVYKRDRAKAMQLMPLVVGIILLFAGNLGISIINNIPLDITSGILNAVLMFWMLYSGHVFKLTLLVSRGNCYILAMGVSVLVFFNMAQGI
ncbi:MAG: diguanylate cyclase, partial [Lachnospiraceae bacterium]|nr:diguanylate cyclase [Lachnospiraceae bacterium]